MDIFYGIEGKYVNVTYKAKMKLEENNVITIPIGDVKRASIFGDHLPGILKHIKIEDKIYKDNDIVTIETSLLSPTIDRKKWWDEEGKNIQDPVNRLSEIQTKIILNHGSIYEEYPEQLMSVKFIKETDTVLEIGGNIGRNSCIIATILDDDKRFVTLECCFEYTKQLEENRDLNSFNFHIEPSALSKVPLMQKGWDTFLQEDPIPDGYLKVNIITFEELEKKYDLSFNVLVIDCEGALYQILKDSPYILKNIERIIIENDFREFEKKKFVDDVFFENGFRCVYSQHGGWGPCYPYFYQVFTKK